MYPYCVLLQSKELIQDHRDHLNATEAQCPVNFFTLAYPPIRNSSVQSSKPKQKISVASVMLKLYNNILIVSLYSR